MKKLLILLSIISGLLKAQVPAVLLNPTPVKTASYNIQCKEFVPCDASASTFTINLPNSPVEGCLVGVKTISVSGTFSVIIKCAGSNVMNKVGGNTTRALSQLNEAVMLQYKQVGAVGVWYTIASDLPYSVIYNNYVPYTGATGSVNLGSNNLQTTGIVKTGSMNIGTLTYTDSNTPTAIQGSVNSYFQSVWQNSSNGNQASCDLVVSNNLGTSSAYYGNFGMNSSTYTGSAVFNIPNEVYVLSQNGDCAVGTQSNNSFYIGVNNGFGAKLDSVKNFISYGAMAIGDGNSPIANTTHFRMNKDMGSAAAFYAMYLDPQAKSTNTTSAMYITTSANTASTAGSYTIPDLTHYNASQGAFGSGSSVTNQWGFVWNGGAGASTINAGFRGRATANTTRWNLYMDGSAQNYINGAVGIGTTTPAYSLHVIGQSKLSNTLNILGNTTISSNNTTTLTVGATSGTAAIVPDVIGHVNHCVVSGNPLASSTYISDEVPFGWSTLNKSKNYLPQAITVTNWNCSIFVNGTLGSAGNDTLILQVNGANTATLSTAITFTAAANSFSGTSTQTVNAGSYLSTVLMTPGYTTAPTSVGMATQYWYKRQ